MPNAHDLAVAFSDLADAVDAQSDTLNGQNLHPGDAGYDHWMAELGKLNTLYNALQDAATRLDTTYGAQRLAGLQSELTSITAATNEANDAIKTIVQINDVLHLVAAAAAAAAAVSATIADPIVGGPTLITSAQALEAAVDAFKNASN